MKTKKKTIKQQRAEKWAKKLVKKTQDDAEAKKLIKYHEAIDMLNKTTRTYLAPSKIHGVGLFALQDAKKDEKLYTDILIQALDLPAKYFHNIDWSEKHQLRPEVRDMILDRYPLILLNSHFFYPDTRMDGYINHSDDPNYDASKDIVLRDIKKGEEITQDYRLIPNWQEVYGDWLK